MRPTPPRALAALVLAAAALPGCAGGPAATDAGEAARWSEGLSGDDDPLVACLGELEPGPLRARVEAVVARLADATGARDADGPRLAVRLLDDPGVAVVAHGPGKRGPAGARRTLWVARGLLAHVPSEGALAAVLAHALAHVEAGHEGVAATRVEVVDVGPGLGLRLARVAGDAVGVPGAVPARLLRVATREDEAEADRRAAELAVAAGYDPRRGGALLRALEGARARRSGLPAWATLHPAAPARADTFVGLAERAARERPLAAGGGRPAPLEDERDAWLAALDGLAVGPDPRDGWLEPGGRALLPRLRCRLEVPRGWTADPARGRLALVSPGGDVVVLVAEHRDRAPERDGDTGESGDAGDADAGDADAAFEADARAVDRAAGAHARRRTLEVLGRERLRVRRRPAERVLALARGEGLRIAVVSTFVRLAGRTVAVHAACRESLLGAREAELEAIGATLDLLDDEDALARAPARLRVVEAEHDGTFEDVVRPWPLPSEVPLDLEGLARLNGLERTSERVARGAPLRVVVR